MRIYVAGRLSSKEDTARTPSQVVVDYIQNVHKMCKVAGELRSLGFSPYVPGVDFVVGMVNGDWVEEDYRGESNEFLKVCQAVLVISDSWGVQQEIKLAREWGIPVFHSIQELYNRYM